MLPTSISLAWEISPMLRSDSGEWERRTGLRVCSTKSSSFVSSNLEKQCNEWSLLLPQLSHFHIPPHLPEEGSRAFPKREQRAFLAAPFLANRTVQIWFYSPRREAEILYPTFLQSGPSWMVRPRPPPHATACCHQLTLPLRQAARIH